MNRKPSHVLVIITAVIVAITGAASGVDTEARAEPGEVHSGALHMVASVGGNTVTPAANIAMGVPFVHSVKVSGDYSVALDGATLRGGEIVAGYLIGCAVDISNGISIGISPSVNVGVAIAPSVGVDFGVDLGLAIDAPPTVGVSAGVGFAIQPSVGVDMGLAGELAVNLAPGTVTAAVIGAAALDADATFPYTFAHTNTPLSVNGCLAPASAMPFITVRADARNGTAQTTGYGAVFTF
ncbi:MspA family porin [Nocardia sp. NPDC005366]|uniref:MspA family porin n=1 Tax=Nocardia sp. NPDC005366 TaxID=3156878 RepID=UPI00339F78C7